MSEGPLRNELWEFVPNNKDSPVQCWRKKEDAWTRLKEFESELKSVFSNWYRRENYHCGDMLDLSQMDDVLYVYAAVRQTMGYALEHASERLTKDKGIVLAAVKEFGWALQFASPTLQNDKEIVLAAVRRSGSALDYASPRLQDDEKIVLAAVQRFGEALIFASERLRDDRKIVLAAVRQDREALMLASERLQNDEEIILAAQDELVGYYT